MSTFAAIITNGIPPLQITMAGAITYDELVFMLGVLNLRTRKIFLESASGPQIDTNIQYTTLDSNGVASQDSLKPRKDPYQKQDSLYFKPSPGNGPIVFNGLSYLSFNILPLQLLTMSFCVDQTDPTTMAPGRNLDNFSFETPALSRLGLFNQMKDCL